MRGALVRAVRATGFVVITAAEAGLMTRPDSEHLEYASSAASVLYTFNVAHFALLHGEWLRAKRVHAGIIVTPQQRFSVGEQLRRIVRLSAARSAEQMSNRLEWLGNWG